jgi:hypothetical protein
MLILSKISPFSQFVFTLQGANGSCQSLIGVLFAELQRFAHFPFLGHIAGGNAFPK